VKAFPYLVAAYWQVGEQLSPTSLLTRILEEYEDLRQEIASERDSLQSILSDLDRMKIAFEDGKLSFELDRPTALSLVGAYLKKSFAKDAGTTAMFKILPAELAEGLHYDVESKLPDRSIYARLLFRELKEDEISSCQEEAQRAAPSEYWLFTLREEEVDIRLEPVFVGENRVMFGRVRCLGLASMLGEMLGRRCEISATRKGDAVKVILGRQAH
jgi:hypothetical protein